MPVNVSHRVGTRALKRICLFIQREAHKNSLSLVPLIPCAQERTFALEVCLTAGLLFVTVGLLCAIDSLLCATARPISNFVLKAMIR